MNIVDEFGVFNLLGRHGLALFSEDGGALMRQNDRFQTWTGAQEGASAFSVFPSLPEDRFRKGLEKRGRFSFDATLDDPMRGQIDVNLTFKAIDEGGRRVVLTQLEDRSREKEKDLILGRATELLEKQNRTLERTNADLTQAHEHLMAASRMTALGEMATSLIVEMQNPLQIIMANASVLDDQLRQAEVSEMLQAIVSSSSRVTKVVERLRALSQKDLRRPREVRRIRDLIGEALRLATEQLKKAEIRVDIGDVDPELRVQCRPTELVQALLNVLQNAVEAVDEDDKWIRVEASVVEGCVHVAITDSGGGLPASLAEKFFEPFFSTKSEDVGQGTGLGLTIARKFAQAHQGALRLDTECEDTRFVLELPLTDDAATV